MINFGISLIPAQASTIAAQVDYLFFFLVAVTGFFTVLIAALLAVFAVKYKRKSDDDKPKKIEGNHLLEAIWIGLPTVLVLFIFFWGTMLYFNMARIPKDGIHMYGVGKQWMWKFQHPEGPREINTLHVPVGTPVKLTLTSEDVIHSFFVPAFRTKADVLPGRYTAVWFEANQTGEFHLFCAEYCGTEHSRMLGKVIAMEPDDYQLWLKSSGSDGGVTASEGSMVSRGEKLFKDFRCNTCHGATSTHLGPNLTGIFGSDVKLTNGTTVVADEEYIRESILTPASTIVEGYQALMPAFQTQINEDDLLQIIEYIKNLTRDEQ